MAEQPVCGPVLRPAHVLEHRPDLLRCEHPKVGHEAGHDIFVDATVIDVHLINPPPSEALLLGSQLLVEVSVLHVGKHPVHGRLRVGVSGVEQRPLARILAEAHTHELRQGIGVGDKARRGLLRGLDLPGNPLRPKPLEVELQGDIDVDRDLLRLPVGADLVAPHGQGEVLGEALEALRGLGRRLAAQVRPSVVRHVRLGAERVQALVQAEAALGLLLLVLPLDLHLLWVLLLLLLPLDPVLRHGQVEHVG
mmetsp:Transcript_7576/g.15040  ORF Transcript_7576/g.15040 Transcript_7576/m.15040 type:complete len:251 (-) Transcript_7576:459-1211(-)